MNIDTSSSHPPPLTGLVLAGGLGRRMGGGEKALVPLRGSALISHVIERLRPQVSEVLVNVNVPAERYSAFGDRIIADRIPNRPGPLAGLHAGLVEARHAWVLGVPCDAPLLPEDLADRLWTAMAKADAEIAVAHAEGRIHPVFCLLSTALAAPLARHLESGGRAVLGWMQSRRLVIADFDDARAFTNVNTPEDLAHLDAPD
jgi:molybdopterin-guanine dinucleotide biosynthesis protein A